MLKIKEVYVSSAFKKFNIQTFASGDRSFYGFKKLFYSISLNQVCGLRTRDVIT